MMLRVFIAGYVACMMTIAAIGLLAKAFSCENWVGVNTVSNHLGTDKPYNEKNWGLFYECRNGVLDWQAGYYRNSFYRDTFYVVGIVRPWTIGRVDIGAFIGPATGYEHNAFAAIAGMVLTFRVTDKVAVQTIANHAVVGLQLAARF